MENQILEVLKAIQMDITSMKNDMNTMKDEIIQYVDKSITNAKDEIINEIDDVEEGIRLYTDTRCNSLESRVSKTELSVYNFKKRVKSMESRLVK